MDLELSTCRPWQVHGHFSAPIKSDHEPADLGRFMATFLNLPTLAGSWPLFSPLLKVTKNPEVQKVRDPGILDARKFLRNQVLAESFGLFLRTFLVGSKVKTKQRVTNLRSFENLTQKLNYITTTTQT